MGNLRLLNASNQNLKVSRGGRVVKTSQQDDDFAISLLITIALGNIN
jgi:hypothetical protein